MDHHIGQTVSIPDGYYPDGRSKPDRFAVITEISGPYLVLRYVGSGEKTIAPAYAAKTENRS